MRSGIGYDVHKLVEGRDLILGGVKIPHVRGLLGHSDADVLLHAITDALLGAANLGDIGEHFPPSDNQWKDQDSLFFLTKAGELIGNKGYLISNIDSIVIAEEPKLKPYKELMRNKIAQALNLDLDQVSVKATTEEGLGFTGTKEGMAAWATVLLVKSEE